MPNILETLQRIATIATRLDHVTEENQEIRREIERLRDQIEARFRA
jgi:regulator of replication initiation timing